MTETSGGFTVWLRRHHERGAEMRNVFLLLLVISTGGCDVVGPRVCTDNVVPALSVYVRDSTSGASVVLGATVIARSGAYIDSVTVDTVGRPPADFPVGLASEHAGDFDVMARQTGYREWSKENVRVTTGECHVQTVTLTALLQPL